MIAPSVVTVATDELFDVQANVTPVVNGLSSVPTTVTVGVEAPCKSQTVVEVAPKSIWSIAILSTQVSVDVLDTSEEAKGVLTAAVIVAWALAVAFAAADAVVVASTAVPVFEASVLVGFRDTLS